MSESIEHNGSRERRVRWVFYLSGKRMHRENPHCGCVKEEKNSNTDSAKLKMLIERSAILVLPLNDIQKKDFDTASGPEGSGWQSRVCTKDPAGSGQTAGATRKMFKSP